MSHDLVPALPPHVPTPTTHHPDVVPPPFCCHMRMLSAGSRKLLFTFWRNRSKSFHRYLRGAAPNTRHSAPWTLGRRIYARLWRRNFEFPVPLLWPWPRESFLFYLTHSWIQIPRLFSLVLCLVLCVFCSSFPRVFVYVSVCLCVSPPACIA